MSFKFEDFFIDRLWVLSIPECYVAYRREPEAFEELRELREAFKDGKAGLTGEAFDVYRTLTALRFADKQGRLKDVLEGKVGLDEFRRWGEARYRRVVPEADKYRDYFVSSLGVRLKPLCFIEYGGRYYLVTRDMVETARLGRAYTKEGEELKVIYFAVDSEFLRVIVNPFARAYHPPFIRLLVNAVNYARRVMEAQGKLNVELYKAAKYVHPNWFFSECGDVEAFRRLNRQFFNADWEAIARSFWHFVFGYTGEIVVRKSQIELATDFVGDKWRVVDALRTLGGLTKTLKVGTSDREREALAWSSDEVLKFYANITKAIQVKVYSKVGLPDGRTLHRLEFTVSTRWLKRRYDCNKGFEAVGEVLKALNRRLTVMEESTFEGLKRLVDPLIPSDVEYRDEHREFLFSILVLGSVKGMNRFRHIAETYKRRGLVKSVGRGPYSYYTLTDTGLMHQQALRDFLKKVGIEIKNIEDEMKQLRPRWAFNED